MFILLIKPLFIVLKFLFKLSVLFLDIFCNLETAVLHISSCGLNAIFA